VTPKTIFIIDKYI